MYFYAREYGNAFKWPYKKYCQAHFNMSLVFGSRCVTNTHCIEKVFQKRWLLSNDKRKKKVSSFSIYFFNINLIFLFRNKLFSHYIFSHFRQAPCWKALISHFPNTCNDSSVYWSQQGSLIGLTHLGCMKGQCQHMQIEKNLPLK